MIDQPPAFVCHVTAVSDGDTFHCQERPVRVRLKDIDAPEIHGCRKGRICAPGDGYASKAALTRILASGTVHCVQYGTDRYRRPLVRCRVNGQDIGQTMLSTGYAVTWPYRGKGR